MAGTTGAMNFASDNWAGASGPVSAALAALAGVAPGYGADDVSRSVRETFSAVFERDVRVFFVSTGTAANVLALETMMRPGGVILCHADAHVLADEGGACEHGFGGRPARAHRSRRQGGGR